MTNLDRARLVKLTRAQILDELEEHIVLLRAEHDAQIQARQAQIPAELWPLLDREAELRSELAQLRATP